MKCDAGCGFPSLPDARFLICHKNNEAILRKNEPLVFLTKDFLFSAVGVGPEFQDRAKIQSQSIPNHVVFVILNDVHAISSFPPAVN